MSFELNSAVHYDIREAIEYYFKTAGSSIASDFYEEFLQRAEVATKSPYSYRIYLDDPTQIRRADFRRFPYHFLYRALNDSTIRILVVRHDHRHPSYGLDRW